MSLRDYQMHQRSKLFRKMNKGGSGCCISGSLAFRKGIKNALKILGMGLESDMAPHTIESLHIVMYFTR